VNLDDTIVAIATPAGRGGIGVVRLSGSEAVAIAAPMLRLKSALEPGRAIFCDLIDHAQRIDEVVVTYFAKPHSYTTDDVVEISAHGSPVILRRMVEMAIERGARLAEPGEFTMRAFLNGRIDLVQAEAVRDLIEAQTLYQARVAAQQLEGVLSRRLQPIKKNLVDLVAALEAGIDFAEDDISVLPNDQIRKQLSTVQKPLWELFSSFSFGKIIHDGLTLAIVGRPNVGKSSLFNRLVERDRAIVTATPGTTRDLVTETVSMGGIPIRLIDTAGIRRAFDEAESIGIQKSREVLAEADMILVVLDASAPITAEDHELLNLAESRHGIAVENKIDLGSVGTHEKLPVPRVRTSALNGDGIPDLRTEILRRLGGDNRVETESAPLTNIRHQGLVKASLDALYAAEHAVDQKTPHEMLLLDLYNALRPLDEITGATTADDILNLIFSRFCIGK